MEKHSAIIQKRLRRAKSEFRNARTLAADEQWDAGTNRLYYAAFYAVSALLLSVGQTTVTHKGVATLFNAHFVKTGQISKEQGQLFSRIFQRRQKSDYDDTFDATAEDLMPFFEPIAELIATIERLILAVSTNEE